MHFSGVVEKSIDSVAWQDYRGSEKGMVVFYASDPVSEIPIREVPEEATPDPDHVIFSEPNYETGTYGFYGCPRAQIRSTFCKSKLRNLFFMTKYAGTLEDYRDKLMVTGYYRIDKIADVQRYHMRYLPEYSCIDTGNCMALRAGLWRFVAAPDAWLITEEVQKEWQYESKITRQTRIMLDADMSKKLIDHFMSRPDATQVYQSETERLQPIPEAGDEGGEEEETGE